MIWPRIVGVRAIRRHGILLVHVRMRDAHKQKNNLGREQSQKQRFGAHAETVWWAFLYMGTHTPGQQADEVSYCKLTKPRRVRPPYHT